ncbi:TRAP-type mannitol/chloroaromatic compound transport system, small permease component [Oryzisolibacter propanilivorax]|uniref:TRAP transporter small permease protein n=1 Tax=Oryzisolibacter propanilivorax TaxID=1527607 RepID=A0A1G9T1B5_9BURK|nr:TRAP transporter small permease [Oryzisolibacter propanilivorax]SDM41418.1 TRAP-type mannitol/chloroaromatic compound transport system, small permease component [Oryzisolibacter propanilivorax]
MAEVFSAPDGAPDPAAPQDAVGRFLLAWSQLSALGGVALLVAVCLLSTWSVVGRAFFDAPVLGDVEMVQVACSLAIASFLPYAQMRGAHVIVDFFTHSAGPRLRAWLDALAALLLAAVAAWLAWRSAVGAWDTYHTLETSMILGWPQWWAHITIAPGFALLALTALYTARVQFGRARRPA